MLFGVWVNGLLEFTYYFQGQIEIKSLSLEEGEVVFTKQQSYVSQSIKTWWFVINILLILKLMLKQLL